MRTSNPGMPECSFKKVTVFSLGILITLFLSPAFAQITSENIFKGSSFLKEKINRIDPLKTSSFFIVVKDRDTFLKYLSDQKLNYRIIREYQPAKIFLIEIKWGDVNKYLISSELVNFIDEKRTAKEELQINGFDLSANKINVVHNKFPQLNGDSIVVSVKENTLDTTDIDFQGRFQSTSLSSPVISSHASIMGTMIAGAGNSYYEGEGVATAATITSSDFSTLLPDPDNAYQQYNISVQNHSYGTGIENFYGADAAAYDVSSINNPSLIHIFSSGNSGNLTSSNGLYTGIKDVANITGSFKMAKNIITAGATDSFGVVSPLSSKGPAYDGRVKPEMLAFGIDGSSGAAALISGVSLLLQQQYKQLRDSLPSNALIKAVLLNSADDVGNKEVDFSNGYGNLNAENAIKTLELGRVLNGSVVNAGIQNFNITIPAGLKKLKLTMVWNDPPAAANASKALVNDLDLELLFTTSGQIWKPWVLNSFPDADSLNELASRKKDTLNNIEQITLDDPLPGTYNFIVKGSNVVTASQDFYIAYQFDSLDVFEWNFPTSSDFIFPEMVNTLRWNSSFATNVGKLEYSIDSGTNWIAIDTQINLSTKYYQWTAPDTALNALLRMTVQGNQYTNNQFVIAPRMTSGIGFNCPDSFLFYWKKIPGIDNYRVYSLGNRYMESILTTTDSFVVLDKKTNQSLYYAVAPLIGNLEGVRSYTMNYALQGVECYVRSFLADLINNSAQLTLSLGTLYNITNIVLEKFDGLSFKPIQDNINSNSLLLTISDNILTKGLNIYRIRLDLAGGGKVYSLPATVYYFKNTNYIVYPNPADQRSQINIGVKNVDLAFLYVYNSIGKKVFQQVLDDRINNIPANILSKGIYFLRISSNGKQEEILKLIVY